MLGIEPALGRTFTPADAAAVGLELPSSSRMVLAESLRGRPEHHRPRRDHQRPPSGGGGRDAAWIPFSPRRAALCPLVLEGDTARTIRTVSGIAVLKPGSPAAGAGGCGRRRGATGIGLPDDQPRLRHSRADVPRLARDPTDAHRDGRPDDGGRIRAADRVRESGEPAVCPGAARQRDMAIRAAMGATRARLIAHVLGESAIVTTIGTAVGLSGALWCIGFLPSVWPEEFPYWLRLDPDVRIVTFTVGLTIFTTLAVGLLPAIRMSRPSVTDPLARRPVLLAGTLLASHPAGAGRRAGGTVSGAPRRRAPDDSELSLQRANLGFDERPLLSLRVFATGDAFDPIPARAALFARALDALKALPGVAAVAATSAVPGDDGGATIRVTKAGAAGPFVGAQAITVTPGLFDTLAVREQAHFHGERIRES